MFVSVRGAIAFVASPYKFSNLLFFESRRRRFLELYSASGTSEIGTVTEGHVKVYRSLFREDRYTSEFKIAYQSSEDNCYYEKGSFQIPGRLEGRLMALKALPGHPGSAIPKRLVQMRDMYEFTPCSCFELIFSVFAMLIMSFVLSAVPWTIFTSPSCNSGDDLCGIQYYGAVVFLVVAGLGYWHAKSDFDQWKQSFLGTTNVPSTAVPADAVALLQAVHTSVPRPMGCHVWDPSNDNDDDATAKDMADRIGREDWEGVGQILAMFRDDAQARGYYMHVTVETIGASWRTTAGTIDNNEDEAYSPMLKRWADADGTSNNTADRLVLTANVLIAFAWHARSSATADRVARDAWPRFFRRLELARTELEHAISLDPTDPLVYAPFLTVLRGSRVRDEAKVQEMLAMLEESRDPLETTAHLSALQFYCAKWGGSNDAMFRYAHAVVEKLPCHHSTWRILLQAHFECALQLGRRHRDAYWKSNPVREDILRVYRQTLGSSSFVVPTDDPGAMFHVHMMRNWFMYCFIRSGDLAKAREQCKRIGRSPQKQPWCYFGDSIPIYEQEVRRLGISLGATEPTETPQVV